MTSYESSIWFINDISKRVSAIGVSNYGPKDQNTPPQTDWRSRPTKLRENVCELMEAYEKMNGDYPAEVYRVNNAYSRGIFDKDSIDAYDEDNNKTKLIKYSEDTMDCHIKYAFFTNIDPFLLLQKFTKLVTCYKNNTVVTLDNQPIYCEGSSKTIVCSGMLGDRSVVVKYMTNTSYIQSERSVYKLIKSKGLIHLLPWYDINMSIWGEPTIVIEKLTPLQLKDDYRNVGIRVLEILKELHKFMVHSDIKPSNIMKKDNTYYLIDFGASVTEKVKGVYPRRAWSELYFNDPRLTNNEKAYTTPKNELIELIYTLRRLQLDPEVAIKMRSKVNAFKRNITGLLGECLQFIYELDDFPNGDAYDQLIAILSELPESSDED